MNKADRALFWTFVLLFFFLPIATSPAVIAGILALAIWIFSGKIITERHRWMHKPWTLPLVLFIVLPWVGLLWSLDIHEGVRFATKTYYFILAFALVSVRMSERDTEILLQAFLAGLFVAACSSLLQVVGILPLAKGVPSLIFAKRIHGSMFLAFGLALLCTYWDESRSGRTRLFLGLIMVFWIFIFGMSGGRSGYVSLLLISPLILYKLTGHFHMKKIALVFLFILLLLLAFGPARDRFGEIDREITAYEQGDPNTSIGIRLHMWKGALHIMKEHPLLGVGTGGYRIAMKRFETKLQQVGYQDINNPHSSFFYMTVSFGFLGLALLLWLFYALLKKGWQARDTRAGFAVLVYGVIVIMVGLTSTTIIDFATSNMMSLMFGIRTPEE